MHRQAQQPFFRVIGHSRRFAWSWGRRGRHQTWVVRSMSQQVKNSTSEKQCVTSTSQWQDKTRTGHEQNKTKQSMTGHANMVNDNMHTHTHMCSVDSCSFVFQCKCICSYGTKDKVRHLHGVQGHLVQKTMSDLTSSFLKTMSWDFVIPKDDVVRLRHSKIPGHLWRPSILHFHLDTWSKSNLPVSVHLRWLTEAAPHHLLTTAKASVSRSPPSHTKASQAGPRPSSEKPSPEFRHQTKIHKIHKINNINKTKSTKLYKIHKIQISNQIFTKWPWKVWQSGRSGCVPWPLSRRTTGPSGASHSCHSWTSGRWSPWRWSWTSWKMSSKMNDRKWQPSSQCQVKWMTEVKSDSDNLKLNEVNDITGWADI